MRTLLWIGTLLFAALVGACAHAPATSPSGAPVSSASTPSKPAPNAATKAASTKANLAIEKVRLAELFRGTPVVIALLPDGSLRVDVPLHFSFDPAKSTVKPPLAAVLDRIATGQLNEITHLTVAAPGDPAAKSTTLVGERASAVRDYLVGRGIGAARLVVTGAVAGVVRVVVMSDAPAP